MNNTHAKPMNNRIIMAAKVISFAVAATVLALVLKVASATWMAVQHAARPMSALGSTVVGDVLETTTPATHLVRDVSSMLTFIRPSRSPLDTILRRSEVRSGSKAAEATKIEWEEDTPIPRTDTLAANSPGIADNATGVLTVTSTDGRWRVDDVWAAFETGESFFFVVTAVAGASVTVGFISDEVTDYDAHTGGAGAGGIASGATVVRIGRAKDEKSTASASLTTMPAQLYNYTQIFETVVGISATRQATKNYTMDDERRMELQGLYDYRRDLESAHIFGNRSKIGSKWTMGGIATYVSTNAPTFTVGSLSESNLIDIMKQAFSGNSGSAVRLLFTTPSLTAAIDKILIASGTLQSTRDENVLGVEATRIHSSFGDMMLINHQELEEMGKTNWGLWVDPAHVRRRPLRPMKTKKVQANNVDGEDTQWLEETTLEVRYEAVHGIMYDSATDFQA